MTKIVKRFENASLDNYNCTTETQKKLIAELKKGVNEKFSNNIIIIGGVGTGKTHLAYALLNALSEKKEYNGYRYYPDSFISYRTVKAIIDEIKASWKDPVYSNPVCDLSKVPLLIIDEIGVQYGTDSERTELYDIFNNRYNDMLPTIVISNNTLPELQRILGQRIYDRLSGGAAIFELTGKSHRQGGSCEM